jgi:membrane protease YdiL (CAAX protease family)
MVGFSEEILWRGYIQTRLIAYGGTIKGLVVTSLLFAVLWHFPVAYYVETSGVVLEALALALTRFPIGLLLGYTMVKSQNIIPSSIIHLFNNWGAVLWTLLA